MSRFKVNEIVVCKEDSKEKAININMFAPQYPVKGEHVLITGIQLIKGCYFLYLHGYGHNWSFEENSFEKSIESEKAEQQIEECLNYNIHELT